MRTVVVEGVCVGEEMDGRGGFLVEHKVVELAGHGAELNFNEQQL